MDREADMKQALEWTEGFEIRFEIMDGEGVLSANRQGLLSLADHLTKLAEEEPGSHIHLDEHNSLEAQSDDLILVRTK